MKRMRLLVVILIIWLFLLYNVERLSKPIDITNVAYLFVPLVATLTILIPSLRRVPVGVLLVVAISVFLALKVWLKAWAWGTYLPLTVTEGCFIAVAILLARWVSNGMSEFESAIIRIALGPERKLPEPFSTGQAEMYREVRRSRHHQRPLALLAIGVEEKSIRVALDRMVQEVQQAIMRQYVLSDIARMLCNELEEYSIIARSNDHFLILLPEVRFEQLTDLVDRLRRVISEQVEVTLRIGAASFPEDALTFEGLVQRAIAEMDEEHEAEPSRRPQCLVTEQTI